MEVLTDKATMEVPSPFAGQITVLQAEEGQALKVGQVVLTYGATTPTEAAPAPVAVAAPAAAKPAPPVRTNQRRSSNGALHVPPLPVKAAPSVRWMARKLGIDIATVSGSGPEGRILIEDSVQRGPARRACASQWAEPKADYGRPGTRIKIQGLRRKIAERMVQSKHTIPHYTYVDECDVTELVRLREACGRRRSRSASR